MIIRYTIQGMAFLTLFPAETRAAALILEGWLGCGPLAGFGDWGLFLHVQR